MGVENYRIQFQLVRGMLRTAQIRDLSTFSYWMWPVGAHYNGDAQHIDEELCK